MLRCLLVVMLMQIPGLAFADTAAALSSCVADNTSGKQRKDLARWVFFAMAAHPDLVSYTTPELGAAREETDRTTADLFVYLITEQCPGEASAAFAERQPEPYAVVVEQRVLHVFVERKLAAKSRDGRGQFGVGHGIHNFRGGKRFNAKAPR